MAEGEWSRALWLLALLLFSACAETRPRLPVSPAAALSFEDLKQRVSAIRSLSPSPEISLETKGPEEIKPLLERSFLEEQGRQNLMEVRRVYERLGLLPQDTDLSKGFEELRLFEGAAIYDGARKQVVLPEGPVHPTAVLLRSPWSLIEESRRQLLLVHALEHAVQEQYFRWPQKVRNATTQDRRLALQALSKGDAVLTGLAFLTGDPSKEKIGDGVKALQRLAGDIDGEMSRFPELPRRAVSLQYLYGSQFAFWGYSLKGWQGVNYLFSNPPLSTKHILHPEKYYVKREDPVRIVPWSLIRQFGGNKILDETLGEFLVQRLLARTLSEKEAAQLAAGWTGDCLLAFQRGEDSILSWLTAWESPESAQQFLRNYRRALERRYGIAFQTPPADGDILIAAAQNGPSLLLQIRDKFVFFLDGVPAAQVTDITDRLWKELETGTDAIPAPLDLGSIL